MTLPVLTLGKEDSAWLKGIAVLLMLWHHLFAFPDRIVPPAGFIPLLAAFDVEGTLARFAKICVPVFFLLSGYGVAHLQRSDVRHHVARALTFMKIYWFYFAVLIPVGILWFPELRTFDTGAQRFNPAPAVLAANLLGVSSTYIGEWWFVEPYVLLTLLSPWLTRALAAPRMLAAVSFLLLVISALFLHLRIDTPLISLTGLAYWQWPFVTGMLCWHYSTRRDDPNDGTTRGYDSPAALRWALYGVAAVAVVMLWEFAGRIGLVLATPLFVMLAAAARPARGFLDAGMRYIGRYSLPVWLVHTALCYFYAQGLVFAPGHSLLVFANLVLLSLLLGVVLETIRVQLFDQLKQMAGATRRWFAGSESGV